MNAAYVTTSYDVSPEAALGAIRAHEGPVLLDLDETLYLGNSTEDFIDSAWPGALALVLLRFLDALAPWRWTGGENTRDVWRVRAISVVFPWTGRRWRARVVKLALRFTNERLAAALTAEDRSTIITTTGFLPIVAPLVDALGYGDLKVVAARVWTCADRRAGKLALTVAALGADTVGRALVITDSAQDLDLLNACARPLRTVWPEAIRRQALNGIYLPGQYLSQVKRPGTRYIVRGILQEDFAFWVLSSIAYAAFPVLHVLGLLFLLVSFWAVYERGYVDNDRVAVRYEESPKLSETFATSTVATPKWQPWLWAIACGVIGVWLLRWPEQRPVSALVAWGLVLLATHGWFHLYNRFDKSSRVWLFAGLQLARGASFVAVVPVGPMGAVGLGAHVLARWVPYYLYRLAGKDWPEAPFHLIRLLFFVILGVLVGLANPSAVFSVTALGLLAWNLFRARQELAAAVAGAHRLDRRRRGPVP